MLLYGLLFWFQFNSGDNTSLYWWCIQEIDNFSLSSPVTDLHLMFFLCHTHTKVFQHYFQYIHPCMQIIIFWFTWINWLSCSSFCELIPVQDHLECDLLHILSQQVSINVDGCSFSSMEEFSDTHASFHVRCCFVKLPLRCYFIAKKRIIKDYWQEGWSSTAIPATSTSDIMSQYNKIRVLEWLVYLF